MKHIVLIGASGFVGSAILREALDRGIEVTAIVRDKRKISVEHKNLLVVEGDIFEPDMLSRIARGKDAVISAYNPGWSNPNIAEETIKGYKSIINELKKAGIKRLQIVGGAGSLYVAPGKTLIDSGEIPENIFPGVKALADVYSNILKPETALDWVFFSPAATLENGKRTANYRLGLDDMILGDDGESRISVQDYAKAMIDELENPTHHRQRFTIGY
ncbi:NAD(P)-dependent oxidoreductase [Dysgonomonas sp. 25]|uniref:NAD(P)-dependent oxidoreductase n=1 Tax=Dysgonomonas sp. 25 TaxID=2302933 RepID=UPI0013D52014|nr:NAD(P)-dependent oxidoreductase [Dysgonomonas sp. 25]NDV67576.1 NAD(P)-dependent oxidoreductase [Dysgonomonas sp. 25]